MSIASLHETPCGPPPGPEELAAPPPPTEAADAVAVLAPEAPPLAALVEAPASAPPAAALGLPDSAPAHESGAASMGHQSAVSVRARSPIARTRLSLLTIHERPGKPVLLVPLASDVVGS